MATIYLIRHGQKELHAGDPGLTPTGIDQAKQTGNFLSQFPITKIVSSPFKRTVETPLLEMLNFVDHLSSPSE